MFLEENEDFLSIDYGFDCLCIPIKVFLEKNGTKQRKL